MGIGTALDPSGFGLSHPLLEIWRIIKYAAEAMKKEYLAPLACQNGQIVWKRYCQCQLRNNDVHNFIFCKMVMNS